jgi:hypothetical protein
MEIPASLSRIDACPLSESIAASNRSSRARRVFAGVVRDDTRDVSAEALGLGLNEVDAERWGRRCVSFSCAPWQRIKAARCLLPWPRQSDLQGFQGQQAAFCFQRQNQERWIFCSCREAHWQELRSFSSDGLLEGKIIRRVMILECGHRIFYRLGLSHQRTRLLC